MKKDSLLKKDLYEQYWRCRNFEIQNLWQRSIFLGTFLALCYTGYGVFCGKAFFGTGSSLNLLIDSSKCTESASFICSSIELSHLIAIAIACVGVVLSILWIFMARASKAWVEVYEAAISAIDSAPSFMPKVYKKARGFHMERLENYGGNHESGFSDCFFSLQGGTFSPSKINIFLGYVSLVIWSVVILFHIVFLFNLGLSLVIKILVAIVAIAAFVFFVFCFLKCFCSSGVLHAKDPRLVYFRKQSRKKSKMTTTQFFLSLLLILIGSTFIAIYNCFFKENG